MDGIGEGLFAHELGRLAGLVQRALRGDPLRGWMARLESADAGVSEMIDEVRATRERLGRLASALSLWEASGAGPVHVGAPGE